MKNIDFCAALFCDDVRIERNHKVFLIGVYPDAVIISNKNTPFICSLYLQFKLIDVEEISLDMEQILSGRLIHKGNLIIKPPNPKMMSNAAFSLAPMMYVEDGDLIMRARMVGTRRWETIASIGLSLDPAAAQ